jgi:5-bromo-4-chloroindolyl phosphate hydrolysis protein
MAIEEAVQVVESTRSGLLSNKRIYRAIHGHKYRPKEIAGFVGLLYSTISVIAKRTAKAEKNQE